MQGTVHPRSRIQPPAQNIYSCGSSDAPWEGKEGTGKLRQRTLSKEKFMAQQKKSLSSLPKSPGRDQRCPSLTGASLKQCKKHRATAKHRGADVLGAESFWQ